MSTLEATKPSLNGVLRLRKRGRVKFQLDDNDPVFELDVIEVYDQWVEVDWQLRETVDGVEGLLPSSKQNEYGQNRLNFVQAIINDAYAAMEGARTAPTLSRAEAEEFVELIREEAKKLRNFTEPKKESPSSSPENSGERINFSQ